MSTINKIRIDGTTYDIEDATSKDRLDNLTANSLPYSSETTYMSGTVGKAIQDIETGNDVATAQELLDALYT